VAGMATRSEDALATILLTTRLVEVDGTAPLGTKEFWSLAKTAEPGVLLGRSLRELEGDVGGGGPELPGRVARLLDRATPVAFELERMERQGMAVLTPFDEAYPVQFRERLDHQAPPLLFVVGPVELLGREGIGVVGSRNVSPEGLEVAEAAARAVVGAGFTVVSGGARGVDQRSMAAAYVAGGQVVGFLAESLDKRVKDPETRRVIGEGAACLATPTNPSAGFSVANAMNRNKLIYGLARVTFVVATDEGSGGTWDGATEALRRGFGPVAVWRGPGKGPGNDALVEAGGHALNDVANLPAIHPPPPSSGDQGTQIALEM
jgi:predicted Rossmann fold nucleotide-binding protein DprA/Smf involved in DNA uptake